ncbi:MAG: bifunctional isocitrate dehydrogenase kinase/phosphatase [Xanthomonadales bacterium]|nr:bifunctional isocitrate dehydrogenase kinase/phosphatase [Xanthomonadales bacterium]
MRREALAQDCARLIRAGFADYNARFRGITQRAQSRFEQRDWAGARGDAIERIELYDRCVSETSRLLAAKLGEEAADRALWADIKQNYSDLVAPLLDQELNKTFYNTLTRRFFKTQGVDAAIEYVALDIEPTDRITHPVARLSFANTHSEVALFERVLKGFRFGVPYRDLRASAEAIAQEVDEQLADWFGDPRLRAVELLETVHYREQRAYLIGRLFGESRFCPLVIALTHEDDGLVADAVMTSRDDVAILFGFTRSYFHADLETVGDAVVFLRTLLPTKPVNELYTVLGRAKQGKTERFRHFFHHLSTRDEHFSMAEGERGMVMAVFTLPSYPLVFKIIRDRFAYPKTVLREEVIQKYQFVFRHDRAGRLVDAQEFRHLRFKRKQFEAKVLEDLQKSCASALIADGDELVIRHMYVERRLRPLNLYLREVDEGLALRAVLDYGQCIRDLALSNVFAGDLLLKNFGVTRHGRVIFYDYDELCLVTDCRFRELPAARSGDEETHSGAWFYVGENDIFPEQFTEFLGLTPALKQALLDRHGELFTAQWWLQLQTRLQAGEVFDIPPYRADVRLGVRPDHSLPVPFSLTRDE